MYIVLVALLVVGMALAWASRQRGGGGVLVDKRFEDLVSGAPESLRVSVEGIGADGRIAVEYTCDGPDRAPRVEVSGVPADAKSVALIMYDPDAPLGTFIHWLAYQPAAPTVSFPSPNAVEGRNDFRRIGYGGPCPPPGHGPHRYFFLVLALDRDPGLSRGYTLNQLLNTIRGHALAWGYAMGTYSR
ncbi:MAG: YbhB/YbcL family Raf kinase inhibitor-like protein [Desulfurococcales archaeon]|nr:YbhB/YbcL family Raf kinase inhibitor-like protein [Desulfurococcales archaeon]